MTKQRLQSQAGFTLIEVGMGALILVVAFIGLIQAVTIGTQMLDTANKQQIAIQIIDAEIEKLRAGQVTDISGLTDGATYTIAVNSAGSVTGDTSYFALASNTTMAAQARDFTVSLVKTNVRSSPTGFRKVVFTVTWTGNAWIGDTARGRTYTRTAEMFFGLNGLQLSFQKS
jgi:Tfp pilus assembly protein PilV